MDGKFAEIFKESKIFADREVLSPHYLPKNLPFRDKQITDIIKDLTPSLKGERGRNLFIYGKTGTGKTSCVKYVVEEVRKLPIAKARIIYVNCRIYSTRYRVLSKIVSDNMPSYATRGYSMVEMYEKTINWIEEDGKTLIVALDEIDMVKDLDDLIYTLTRANSDLRSGGITVIGISNNTSFKDVLDPRSLSTLYENELVFPPYDSKEIATILKERVEKGFQRGVVDDETISLAAAMAAKEGGDARLALKIISKAGELAEERGSMTIGAKEVHEAENAAEQEVAYEVIVTLPEHEKLVLYAIALLNLQGGRYKKLTDGDENPVFSGEVYNRYVKLTGALNKEPKTSRWYRKYIADLEMQGLIDAATSGKGIRGRTKLIRLEYPAEKIKGTIEKDLFIESGAKPA